MSVFTGISYDDSKMLRAIMGHDKTAKEVCLVQSEHVRVTAGNQSLIFFFLMLWQQSLKSVAKAGLELMVLLLQPLE